MKMMGMKAMMMIAGMGALGYMYLKNNPKMMKRMCEIGKEASRKMYNKFDVL